MISPWIRLHSGKKFHLLEPKPEEIDIEDIIHNLSHICRFTGAVSQYYSVLEHCCRCHDAIESEYKKEALAHDFSEAYLSDITSVLKGILPQYKKIENKVETVIAEKFKFRFPYPDRIKEIDLTLLATEMRDLLPVADYKILPFDPLPQKIVPWSIEKARREFRKRFNKTFV